MKLHLGAAGCNLPYHTALPATWHKWTHPRPVAGTRFTCPGGMEDWVDL